MIRWITSFLGTSAASSLVLEKDEYLLDVRNLVDRWGNPTESVKEKLREGISLLRQGHKVIVGCDYGMSRSNAIAAGLLAIYTDIVFEEAVRKVIEVTGAREIKLGPLDAVRKALGKNKKKHPSDIRILMTGSSGFIGKALTYILEKQLPIFAPLKQEIDLMSGSVQLDMMVKDLDVTHVVHLANPRVYTSNIAMGESLTILRNILEICVSNGLHLIYPSGWEIYSGYRSTGLLANEALPARPKGPYGETKWLCEIMIDYYRRQHALRCGLIRSSALYSGSSDRPKFIRTFIDCAREGKPIYTHEYRNGFPGLDLMHINDFCTALSIAINQGFEGDLNLGTGRLLSTRDVAIMIREKLGSLSDIRSQKIDDYAPNIMMETSLARELLSWMPSISFENSLEEMIEALP